MSMSPNYTPDDGDWICEACACPLEQQKVQVFYLESAFDVSLPACPRCKRILIPKSLAEGKMLEVEALLEDK
ncbi:MAG: DNA-binding protein [Desulfobulbus sp.]|nr:DNA-binding protein [Desulfobulbus sp.]